MLSSSFEETTMAQGASGEQVNRSWNQWFREWLATIVVVVSLVAVALLGVMSTRKGDAGAAKDILTMILPMIGTWVGTVLAFYFGKEQLEAATRSVTAIARELTPEEKLRSLKVATKMIPRAEVKVFTEEPDKLKLLDAIAELDKAKKGNRLPILTTDGRPFQVIHRSIIDRFIAKSAAAGKTVDELRALTLADLLQDSDFKDLSKGTFAIVAQTATLADAKRAMESLPWCQDVFVSQSGASAEPVVGWVTNAIIEANSRV
jgi:hypothetical protein